MYRMVLTSLARSNVMPLPLRNAICLLGVSFDFLVIR